MTVLFPKQKNNIFWLTAILFVFWKSPYSQAFIDIWNNFDLFSITRVVDYSDLIALTVLPFAYYIYKLKESNYTVKLTPIIPFIFSIFAFVATSKKKLNCFDYSKATYNVKHYSRDSLIHNLKNIGLNVTFSKYHNTQYDNEHSEIHNLNDSIQNLAILIRSFNSSDKTVKIILGCWTMANKNSSEKINFKTLENEKLYIKNVFEKEVVKKIEKKFTK